MLLQPETAWTLLLHMPAEHLSIALCQDHIDEEVCPTSVIGLHERQGQLLMS